MRFSTDAVVLCFQHNLRLVVRSGTLLCLLVGQLHALTALKSQRLQLLRHASARHRRGLVRVGRLRDGSRLSKLRAFSLGVEKIEYVVVVFSKGK